MLKIASLEIASGNPPSIPRKDIFSSDNPIGGCGEGDNSPGGNFSKEWGSGNFLEGVFSMGLISQVMGSLLGGNPPRGSSPGGSEGQLP